MAIIDLSQIPAPNIVEPLDYETLLEERKAKLLSLIPVDLQNQVAYVLGLETEPLTISLQESAYRELVLRNRINDAARAVMLAYAIGSDLDQIGANYGITRLVVQGAVPDAIPPVDAVLESDDDFRYRIQLSLDGYTTAGSKESYIFHGLSADGKVLDIDPVSDYEGVVTIYVLSRDGNGTASAELIRKVEDALNGERTRPMTDLVNVLSASIIEYQINAELVMPSGPDRAVVLNAAIAAAQAYANSRQKIGFDVAISGIHAALHQSGVTQVNLASPSAHITVDDGQCTYCTAINISISETPNV